MIIRNIGVDGFGCFADAFQAGPFGPGINIVSAPNGAGKSTIFRALSLAFCEPHRGKSQDVQALRPWGRRLAPEVTVEFEHSKRLYRVRKRFLDSASVRVETSSDGESWSLFGQSDQADSFLREVLRIDAERPKYSRREDWGLAQVLWTTQGDLTLPPLASDVVESIRGPVGAQLASRDASIQARVTAEYQRCFAPKLGRLKSGRNAAPQVRLQQERDRLAGEVQTAEELLRRYEAESEHIEQQQTVGHEAAMRHEALKHEAERLRGVVMQWEKLRGERRERLLARDAAQPAQMHSRACRQYQRHPEAGTRT